MFGPKKPPQAADCWVVRDPSDKQEYVAESWLMLRSWYQNGQVPETSEVFDPENQKWVRPGQLMHRLVDDILITTTSSVDGFRVARYLGIESVEIAIGSGSFSDFSGDIADLYGAPTGTFEANLLYVKRVALDKLRFEAFRKGGNAVIATDLSCTEFSKGRVGVIARGTSVVLERNSWA